MAVQSVYLHHSTQSDRIHDEFKYDATVTATQVYVVQPEAGRLRMSRTFWLTAETIQCGNCRGF